MYGTVARIRSWLLIEYPAVWHRDAVEGSRLLPHGVKTHLRQLEVDRTLLVRQTHTHRYPLRTFFVDSCGDQPFIRQHEFEEYEQLTQLSRGLRPLTMSTG